MPVINTTTDSTLSAAPPTHKAFVDWTVDDAKAAIAWAIQVRVGKDGFEANRAYSQDHDHLQNGDGWIGPLGGDDMAQRSRVKDNVKRQFTPVDTTAEVLDNLANALLQNPAVVSAMPKKPPEDPKSETAQAQAKRGAAFVAVLNKWVEDRELLDKARQVVQRSRWATWACARLWMPDALATPSPADDQNRATASEDGESEDATTRETMAAPTGIAAADALARLFVSAPPPDQAFVYTDPDTQQQVGIFLYRDNRRDFAELCWVDPDGVTVRKRMQSAAVATIAPDPVGDSAPVGGVLPVIQLGGELLITEPVRMQQAALNFYNSVMVRVIECAGFAERYIINAMPEGTWTSTPPLPNEPPAVRTQIVAGVTWYLIPADVRTLGHSVSTELRGEIDKNEASGEETTLTPNVIFKEPTDPAFVIRGVEHARGMLLHQCKQGHLANTSTAESSGFAYVQARAPHVADVTHMRKPTSAFLAKVLAAACHYAAVMSPELVAWLAEFDIVVTIHINLGPVPPEEQTAILARLAVGAISLQTALTLLQQDDVAEEIERIRTEPAAMRKALLEQVTIGASLISSWHLDQVTVAEIVGLDPEIVKKIKAAGTVEPDPAEGDNPPPR